MGKITKTKSANKLKLGDGLKDVTAIIDSNILSESFGSCLLSNLVSNGIKYEINQTTRGVIKWKRQHQQILEENEVNIERPPKYTVQDFILKILMAKELNDEINQNTLQKTMETFQELQPLKKITILVYGIKEFCRKCKNVGRQAFETNLANLQILLNINHRLIETSADLEIIVLQFSKSIGDIPFKKQQAELLDDQNFYVTNDNKDCVAVKGNTGLSSLWQHHLTKLPLVSLETAEAIIGEFPMPRSLLQAYESSTNGVDLLTNIPVRRAGGPLTSVRKIGPELSKKVHALYTNTDPTYVL